jgi:hypothetical protein
MFAWRDAAIFKGMDRVGLNAISIGWIFLLLVLFFLVAYHGEIQKRIV